MKKRPKVHDYTRYEWGQDFIFESIGGGKGYMTGQGLGISSDDYIVLRRDLKTCRYQVERVDYYSNSLDTWIALLIKVSDDEKFEDNLNS